MVICQLLAEMVIRNLLAEMDFRRLQVHDSILAADFESADLSASFIPPGSHF